MHLYSYAAPGVKGWGTTYLIEGCVQAGKGNYNDYVSFTVGDYSVVFESDDGTNYSIIEKAWQSKKRYLKAIAIPQNLSAAEELAATLNILQTDTCSVNGNRVTLNKDFTCPHEISIPTGDSIILDFNGHTVTTSNFFSPFFISEQAEITFTGTGTLTNAEKSSRSVGGVGPGAALVPNEGKLVIDGITIIGVGLCGISNDGELVINSGTITAGSAPSAKDAIFNTGTIIVNGGRIIGGDTTRDGRNGGNGIASHAMVHPADEIYPIKLNGGELHGGAGLGDGENGRAITTGFNIGEKCLAYESSDGKNYSSLEETSCRLQYLRVTITTSNPTISGGGGSNLGTPSSKNSIAVENMVLNGGKITFDLSLISDEEIGGMVYVAVFDGKKLSHLLHFTAKDVIPVSIDFADRQNIKIFWWGDSLSPVCPLTEL